MKGELEVDLLCALSGPDEERIAAAFGSTRGRVRVVRRCADIGELVAAAVAGVGTVALISEDQHGLSRELIAELHGCGLRVLGLVADADGWQAKRLWALGVDAVRRLDITIADLTDLLGSAEWAGPEADAPVTVSGSKPGEDTGVWEADHLTDQGVAPTEQPAPTEHIARAESRSAVLDLPGSRTTSSRATDPRTSAVVAGSRAGSYEPAPESETQGRIIAVWGTGGAPGRTSIAINLAMELTAPLDATDRRSGAREAATGAPPEVLVVDADTHNPSLVQHLALLDDAAGLALAARAASQGFLDVHRLAELTPRLDTHLRILTGIGRASRWPEAPGTSLDALWHEVRRLADITVIDCGPMIERDEALSYDTRAPQRNGATTSALDAADVVVIVGSADPVGVQRLVRSLEDLADSGLALGAERVVLINRVRPSVVGAQPVRTLRDALARYAGIEVNWFIDHDPAAFDAAILAGRTLAEVAPHSAARRTIADLALTLR